MMQNAQLDYSNGSERTAALLMSVCNLKAARAHTVAMALDAAAAEFDITSDRNFGAWVAQMSHESGNFRYSDEIWGATPEQLRYDTRTDLGNTPEADGDGYENRGAGWMQITGDSNLTACAIDLNIPRAEISARLRDDPMTSARGAAWWWRENKVAPWAEKGDINAVSGLVNRGNPKKKAKHLAERIERYNAIMRFLSINEPVKPPTPLSSRTMQGSTLAGGGLLVQAAVEVLKDPETAATVVENSAAMSNTAMQLWQDFHALSVLGISIAAVGLCVIIYARYDDYRNHKR